MSLDYATFARIEDHLRRIADALERPHADRLPELVDIARRGLDRVAASFRLDRSPDDSRLAMQDLAMELRAALDAKPCDDRTCTDRDHWAPRGRINHGSTPTTCVHGQDHSDALECVYGDTGVRVRESQASSLETGRPVRVTVTNRKTGAILFDGDMATSFLDLPPGGWSPDDIVQPISDPLDESDHRPRHDRNGEHLYRWGTGHWHSKSVEEHTGWCDTSLHNGDSLADWARASGPLTFCDCDDAATEAENGATD